MLAETKPGVSKTYKIVKMREGGVTFFNAIRGEGAGQVRVLKCT